jgi:hypothetical protein
LSGDKIMKPLKIKKKYLNVFHRNSFGIQVRWGTIEIPSREKIRPKKFTLSSIGIIYIFIKIVNCSIWYTSKFMLILK